MSTHSLNSDTTLGPSGVVTADYQRENQLWDALTTHHMLPVFAAAKAFVPTSFESLLVQVRRFLVHDIMCLGGML